MATKPRDYVEIVVRVYPDHIQQHTIDYLRGRTHDFIGSLHVFNDRRRPRVVSVRRVKGGTK